VKGELLGWDGGAMLLLRLNVFERGYQTTVSHCAVTFSLGGTVQYSTVQYCTVVTVHWHLQTWPGGASGG
jgi:hypothetical protein